MKLSVNQNGLIQNLKFVFSGNDRAIGELIQNARRAGSKSVHFTLEDGVLVVEDYGSGIQEFEQLFTIAQSGWDVSVKKKEHPYGLGFLSTLYFCEHLSIHSQHQFIEFDTHDLLSGNDIGEVETVEFLGCTQFTMHGLSMSVKSIEYSIIEFAKSSSIEVFFNGKSLPRPYSIEHCSTYIDKVGVASVDSHDFSYDAIYLQDLPVWISSRNCRIKNFIHLDSDSYFARMPDRDCLINETEQIAIISNQWRVQIHEKYLLELLESRDSKALNQFNFYPNDDAILIQYGYIAGKHLFNDFTSNRTQSTESYGLEYFEPYNGDGLFDDELENVILVKEKFLSGAYEAWDRMELAQNRLHYLYWLNTQGKSVVVLRDTAPAKFQEKAIDLDFKVSIGHLSGTIDFPSGMYFLDPFERSNLQIALAESMTMHSQFGSMTITKDNGLMLCPEDCEGIFPDGVYGFVYTHDLADVEHMICSVGYFWFDDDNQFDLESYNEVSKELLAGMNQFFGLSPIENLKLVSGRQILEMLQQVGCQVGDRILLSYEENCVNISEI